MLRTLKIMSSFSIELKIVIVNTPGDSLTEN